MKIRPFLFLIIMINTSACTTTNYYLVRHAERLDNSSDSPLSEAGHARAQALKELLLPQSIDSILVSTRLRTQQTGQPLADALHIKPAIYSPDTTAGTVQGLRLIEGKDVLLVGHSNTVPEIVMGLCGQAVQIADNDYDNLFVVSKKRFLGRVKIRLDQRTYGAPSP